MAEYKLTPGQPRRKQDIILGDEPVDPTSGLTLTDEDVTNLFQRTRPYPGGHEFRGKVPKSYTRILGEKGYDPEFSYGRTAQKLAEEQSGFGQFANAMNQAILGEVVGGTIQGIGYLGKLLDIGSMIDGTEQDWGNTFSKVGEGLKTWTREVSPIYEAPGSKAFDPGRWSWWMSHAPFVASTLSLMLPAAGVVRGIGAVGNLLGIASKMGATAEWMVTGIGQAIISRHMENMMEASGVHKDAKQASMMELAKHYATQIEKEIAALPLSMPYDPENPGAYTQENKNRDIELIQNKYKDIIEKASDKAAALAASNTYRKQWAMLIQDIPQYLLLNKLGGMGKGTAKESAAVLKKMGVNPANTYLSKAGAIGRDMLGEAGEEMYQFLVNEQSAVLAKHAGDPAIKHSLKDILLENYDNGEMWTAATFGALGAGVMQGAFAGINAKAIRASNKARIENINRFGPSFAHAAAVYNEALDSKDPIRKEVALDNLLVNLGLSAKEFGNEKHAINFINSMRDPSDDTLERFGITENERFLADNPDVADKILENLNSVFELHDQFTKEGGNNSKVKKEHIPLFARNMTLNRFQIDRAKERLESSQQRIDANESIKDFKNLSPQLKAVKEAEFQKAAIQGQKKRFEKLAKNKNGKATKEQLAKYDLILAQANLALDIVEEDIKNARKELDNREDALVENDKLYDGPDPKNPLITPAEGAKYVAELEAIENTKAAIKQAEEEIKQFREGKGYIATKEERDEYEQDLIDTPTGISPGDKVSFVDDAGQERSGEVQYIKAAVFDSENNPIEPESDNADNFVVVQPLDEKGEYIGEPISLKGDQIGLVEARDIAQEVSYVEDPLTSEEEGQIGLTTAYARDKELNRGTLEPISNLSYSHSEDNTIIKVRNDEFNKVISDPNTNLKNATATYHIDEASINDYIESLNSEIKKEKEIRKAAVVGTETYKTANYTIKRLQRQLALTEKMKNISSLTEEDKTAILLSTTGSEYDDIADKIRINVSVNIDGTTYTKGLMLHVSGYDRIKMKSSVRRKNDPNEIDIEKAKKKERSRAVRIAILGEILNGVNPSTYISTIGRGAPRTIDKSLDPKKREVSPIDLFNIEDTNKALLGISVSNTQIKDRYYKAKIKTGATTEHDPSRTTTVSTVGGTFLITKNTINGKPYAYKLNNKKIDKDTAELIFDSFKLLARSNIWAAKLNKKKGKEGVIGLYDLKYPKEETRVSGLSIGELLDLVVVHGEGLTNPDGARYKGVILDEEHLATLRRKRLYTVLSDDGKFVPYLIFGTKNEKTGRPYQVDLRSDSDIEAHKDIFIEWMTENKAFASHLVNKMLKLELNKNFLNGRNFRIGEKDGKNTLVRRRGENYNTFLLKNLVTADAEKGENGLAFHAPTVDLNLVTKNGKPNLMKPGEINRTEPVKPVDKKKPKVEKTKPKELVTKPTSVKEIPFVKKVQDEDYSYELQQRLNEINKRVRTPEKRKEWNSLYKKEFEKFTIEELAKLEGQNLTIHHRTGTITFEPGYEELHIAEKVRKEKIQEAAINIRNFTPEDPAEDFPSPGTTNKSIDDIMNDFEDDGGLYTRRYNTYTKQQDLHKELNWVIKKVGIKKNQVKTTKILADLMQKGYHNFALYSHSSILLLEAAETGTLYHEAFHRVSLGYLSLEERKRLYRTARQVYKMPEGKYGYTERQVEEKLAEEFREYVLLREENKPSGIRKVFQDILDFITALFGGKNRINKSDINAMFNSIYRGDFRFSKVAKGNISNIGAERYHRQINGTEFNSIVTRKQQLDLVKNLVARLFTLSDIEDLNSVTNIDYNLLIKDLEDKISKLESIINDDTISEVEKAKANKIHLMFSEVLGPKNEAGQYINFPIFQEKIERNLNFLGIKRKYTKEPDKLDSGFEEDEVIKRGDSDYAVASYEVSTKDTALSSIKFMVQTIYESDKVDPVTNFRPFVDFNEVWHKLLFDLHDHTTIDEMIETLYEKGITYDYFPYLKLAEKLKKAKPNTQTQFVVTMNKHRHEFINFMFNYSKKVGASFEIEDSSYKELSRISALKWNENLRNDSAISTMNDDGSREVNEKFFADLQAEISKIKDSIIEMVDLKKVTKEALDKAVLSSMDTLNKMHVVVDKTTMDVYIDGFENDLLEDRMLSMLGELDNIIVESVLDKNLINNPISQALSRIYADVHPDKATDVNIGPKDNKYYNYSQHSLATDITNKINKDEQWIADKKDRIYNKHSLILNNLLANEEARKNFSILTFSKISEGRGDLGRDFLSINKLEDYLIKQAALFDTKGLLPFPVMANRKTYFFMEGGIKPIESVIVTSNEDNTVEFDKKVIETFWGYYKDEEERVLATKATIKEYKAAEGEMKDNLQSRLIKNLHYVDDFDTDGANGVNFIHFKGYKTRLTKEAFAKKFQKDFNDRLKEELEYADEIGVISYDKSKNEITSGAMSEDIYDRFEDENISENHGYLHALAYNMVNQYIAVMEAEKIFIADPAQFKRTKNTDIDVYEDLYKRWFGIGSSGNKFALSLADESDGFNVATFKDQIFESDYYKTIYDKHVDLYTKTTGSENAAKRLATERLKAYKKVDPTDGQMIISPEMFKKMAKRLGEWPGSKDGKLSKKEQAFNLLQSDAKLTEAEELEALNIVFNPIKTVYMGHHNHDNTDLLIYDKMSMTTLFRRNVKGSYLEKVLDRMEAKGEYEGLDPIDAIKFESAVKVGGMRSSKMFTDSQKRNEIADLSNIDIYTQTFDNLKHQLETDVHDANRQTLGTQAFKSLISDIIKNEPYGKFESGQALIDAVVKSRVALSNLGVDRVNARLGVKNGRMNNEKLVNMLKMDATLAGKSDDFINALKVDSETGEMFLELDSFSDRRWVYSRIMTIVNRENIDLNLPGNQLIQVTDYGMNKVQDKELGFSYSKKGSTEVFEMEARVSIRLFKKYIPNYDKLSFDQKKAFVMNNLEVLGYRIPTQGQNSIVKLKIVELLREQAGDVIHLPLEFTALTGSDFDIDKLYVATYNYRYDRKTKSLKKIEFNEDDSEEAIDKRYRRKVLEMYGIYATSPEVFSEKESTEIRKLLQKKKIQKNISKLYRNEGRQIVNAESKLEIIERRRDNAESEEEKTKWGEMALKLQEDIDYMHFVTGISRNLESMTDEVVDLLYNKTVSNLVNAGKISNRENFSKLSIENQNTRVANENRLLDIFFTVLTDEKHYIQTSTPLGALTDKLKDKAEAFEIAARGKKDRSLPTLKMGTPSFQAKTKSTYVGSDAGIGPSALANAHHGLTQHAGIQMKTDLDFGFNEKGLLAFDKIEGEDKINITSWLSALIDAHVDAIKDPYIMSLNVNEATLNSLNFMLRVGVGEVAFDLLSQPVLKQYADSKLNELGTISNLPTPEDQEEKNKSLAITREQWRKLYYAKGGKQDDLLEPDFYIDLKTILKGNDLIKDIDSTTKKDKEYYRRQLSVLEAFAEIDSESEYLKRLVMASRIDTKKYGSTPAELNIFLSRIKQIEEENKWVNLDKLVNSRGELVEGGTMLAPLLKNSVLYLQNILSKKSIYGTPGFNSILFDSLLYSTKAGNKSSNATIRMLTEELMSFMIGQFFADSDLGPGLNTDNVENLIYDPKYSVFSLINSIKRGTHPHSEYLKENAFINALIVDYSQKADVLVKQSIKFPFRTLNDLWDSDDYIEAFAELLEHPESSVRQVAKTLYYYSFYSSGFRNRLYSFNTYMPAIAQRELEVKDPRDPSKTKIVGLNNFIKQLLVELSDGSQYTKYALDARREVFTNNWWNENLVPKISEDMVLEEYTSKDIPIGYTLDLDMLKEEFLGKNEEGTSLYTPYLLLEEEDSLLEFIGLDLAKSGKPVYRTVAKKGFQSKGIVLKEYGLDKDRSVIPDNNPDKQLSLEESINIIKDKTGLLVIYPENQNVTDRNPIKDWFVQDVAAEMRDITKEKEVISRQPEIGTKIKHKIPMNFRDGTGNRKMRPEFKGKSTMDLVLSGDRTATSRDVSKSYNRFGIQHGDIVQFYDKQGRTALVRVVLPPYSINEGLENVENEDLYEKTFTREEKDKIQSTKEMSNAEIDYFDAKWWSALEGWSEEMYYPLEQKGTYEQFTFELISKDQIKEKQTTLEFKEDPITPSSAISTPSNPIEVFVDGSVKGPKDALEYGYGAWSFFGGKASGISGSNAKVEELLFSKFPELKGQDQANPSMELLGTLETVKAFENTAEHIVILQDYKGAINFGGLHSRAVESTQKANKPWVANKKGDTPHIEYLVNEIVKSIEKIEDNGGSVKIKWIPGHIDKAKIAKHSKAFQDNEGKVSSNLISQYTAGNNNADIAAKSTKEKVSGIFAKSTSVNEGVMNKLNFSNEQLEEGEDNVKKCKE